MAGYRFSGFRECETQRNPQVSLLEHRKMYKSRKNEKTIVIKLEEMGEVS